MKRNTSLLFERANYVKRQDSSHEEDAKRMSLGLTPKRLECSYRLHSPAPEGVEKEEGLEGIAWLNRPPNLLKNIFTIFRTILLFDD